MKKGDLVGVVWCDIQTDPIGDPDTAEPRVVRLPGYFHGYKGFDIDGTLVNCLILRVSHDTSSKASSKDIEQQTGWWCIPEACVASIKKLKKGR